MARTDLLALSLDDLTTLSNRGLVKRAQQEIEAGDLVVELAEDEEGTVTARWSDDVECTLPAGEVLANGRCSCPATTLCRHLIRTVLAYQRQAARPTAEAPAPTTEASVPAGEAVESVPPSVSEPWDPGAIEDSTLEQVFAKVVLARARRQFEEGHLLELVRAAKPTARDHTLGFNLRFLVPGDARYTHCDCSEPAPCSHVPLAILAFRLLAPDRPAGLVSTRATAYPTPAVLLDEIEQAVDELAVCGLANVPAPLMDRFRRLETRCRTEGLIWPAEIVADIVQQRDTYARHDARFSPARLVELVGELCIRLDAVRSDTGAAPQLFLRGAASDRMAEVGSARLVGLGCGVEVYRGGVRLVSYLQDLGGGMIVVVRREFPDAAEDAGTEPQPFWQLARAPVFKGANLASLGAGQMLVKGGKRSPNREFLFGRAPVSVTPQAYQWELLRPPVLAESFREVAARLSALPPAPLRPRRLGEDFHVCPVAAVDSVRFAPAEQAVVAVLRDAEGGTATLFHPYTTRGCEGAERLLVCLREESRVKSRESTVRANVRLHSRPAPHASRLRFVAGPMRLQGAGLVVAPVGLVVEEAGVRTVLQPWVDRLDVAPGGEDSSGAALAAARLPGDGPDPLVYCREQVTEGLGELLVTGLQRAGEPAARSWRALHHSGASLGFARLLDPLARLVACLEARRHTMEWDPAPAARSIKELAAYVLLVQEG